MPAAVRAASSMSFTARLATAFVELALATTVIVGAIVVGHNLREWRDWYPTVYHPWADAQRTVHEVSEP
jgi:hypothetical protein